MSFEVEWLDAPGVRDRVLAATWARLRIQLGGRDLIELVHLPSNTRRVSVYGPVFPLAEWFVENWWSILYEPPRGGSAAGRVVAEVDRPWVARHNLLAAREGGALPDVTFVGDHDEMLIRWFEDPPGEGNGRVRFVGSGEIRLDRAAFEDELASFVDMVIERVSAVVGDDQELERVAAAWAAIQESAGHEEEREICLSLATMGLDPYDPADASDELVELLVGLRTSLPAELRGDLLETARPESLAELLAWLEDSRGLISGAQEPSGDIVIQTQGARTAHEAGYMVARRARELLGLEQAAVIDDLEGLLVDRLGWDPAILSRRTQTRGVEGLVGLSKRDARPLLVSAGDRVGPAKRFLLARGVFFPLTGVLGQGRLLTKAATWPQRAARAFAAEFLAPAGALERLVDGPLVSYDEIRELSERFGVDPMLIHHQIENHRIGFVA